MAGNKRISAIIALDGEKEFKQAVNNVNAELKNLKAQTSYVKEEFKEQANSLAALEKKNELLTKTLDAQNRKQQEVEKGLKNSKKTYDDFGEQLKKLKTQCSSAENKLKKMEHSSKSSTKELEAQRKEVERLKDGLAKSELKYQTAANRVDDWSSKLHKAKEETLKAEKALKENNTYLDEARSSADKCATSIDKYGKKVKEAAGATLDWNEATKAAGVKVVIEKAADVVGDIASEAMQTAKDVTSAANQIQASTGIMAESAEKYQEVLLDVYKNNYGENMQDVASVIAVVKQNMQDLNKQDLKKTTESAITLRDTFDMDVKESIRGANALMEHMNVSATEAFDLIAKGAQKGLNKTDELGDNLAEYAQIWGQAGFSAEQMFAILDNGLNAGAYNLDKVNDFVKEFTISLSDGRIEENIGKFSLNTQQLFTQLQEGNVTASEVFQSIINDLGNMTNQQEALTLASTVWSAVGEDNAMKVITSLNNVNDTYKSVEGTMNTIKDIKYDDLTNQITQTARTIQMKIAEPLAKEWLPEINKALEFTGDHLNELGIAGMGLGGVIAANKILSSDFGKSAIKVLKMVTTSTGAATAATIKQTVATKALTAEQKIYNAVASMNPASKVILAITAAVGAYKLLETAVINSNEELMKNREEVEKLCEEYEELKSSIESAREERAETLEGIEAEYTSYQTLADNLVELSEKENKSNGEKALMKTYVDQLNEAIPSLSLSINEETGSLNMSSEAIYKNIDALKEKAKCAAYEEMITEEYKAQAEAEAELTKLQIEREDIQKRMAELVKNAVKNVSAAADNTMRTTNQIKSPSRLYKKYGKYITEGLAIGIDNAKAEAQKSMSNVCNGLVKTAKSNLDIHSPSRKFQKEVGEQISKGVAFGISAKKGTAIKNAKELADDVYKAASSWLTAYKKTHELSLDDEKYFWEKVVATTKKGTEAYEKALKKVTNITTFQNKVKNQISGNFGVKKESDDSAEDYYNNIFSAASKYFDNYTVLHNVSLEQEEYYWKAVQKKLKKGTQAYIDATKKLKAVQAEIADNLAEQKGLEKYYAYLEETIKKQEKNLKEVIGNSLSGAFTKAVSSSLPMKIADEIKDSTTIAANQVEQMQKNADLTKQMYTEAVKWLNNYKKTHNVSLADEKFFWQKIAKSAEKGTSEYVKAMKKLKKLEGMTELQYNLQKQLKNAFDVSKYTIDSDGKKVKKSTEEYYDEIYSAAQQYFDNYSVFHTVSLEEEEEYWKAVRKKLQKGTQAYIDATKNLKAVQEEIKAQKEQEKQDKKDYALSGGALDAYKTYYQVSERAEMQYWNKVRKKFKEGTAERIEADQKYYEAKENYNNKLEELNEEYYENCKEVNEKLEDDINSLMETYKESVSSRKESIMSSFNLFDEFSSTSSSGATLLYNLKTQVAGIADWEQQLQTLGNKNILSDDLLQELANMGPEASASIHALNQLSEEQLKEYQTLWEQKNALAEAQAVKENEALREQTQAQIEELKSAAQEEMNAYKEAYTEAVAEVKTAIEEPLLELASQATKIGEETVYSMIAAIKDGATAKETKADLKTVNTKISKQLGKLEKAGQTIGENTLQGILDGLTDTKKINQSAKSLVDALKKAIQKEADIHSPSRLFKKEIGLQLSAGVADGITENTKKVNQAGTDMISVLLEQQKKELITRQETMKSYLTSINDIGGITELNRLISVAPVQQVTANVDNTGLMAMLSEMIAVMQVGFKEISNLQVVTDTGALIGETSSGMSEAFALMNRRRR